jgi:MerR family mercuric resistance operon transcriptional regulator
VRFIKHAQELGFSLKEIKELLCLRASPKARCGDIRDRAVTKISDVEARIHALQAMKKVLEKLVAECPGWAPLSSCPILEALDTEKLK